MVELFSKKLTDNKNKRPKRWRELFEIRVILAMPPREVGRPFLYHLQGYQRKRWVAGSLNISSKTILLNEIKKWLVEVEGEISRIDWELPERGSE